MKIPTTQGIPADREQAAAASREIEAYDRERRRLAAVEDARRQEFDEAWKEVRERAEAEHEELSRLQSIKDQAWRDALPPGYAFRRT